MFSVRHRSAGMLLAIFALATSLHAVPVRFLAWDDAIAARKIGFQNGKDVIPLADLHPHKRSGPVDATGDGPITLAALDRPDPDGKPLTISIKAAAEIKSPLVLILPDPKHPSGMRGFVIDDDSSGFSWGEIRLINATGKELAVRCEKIAKLLPKSWTPVDIDPGGKNRNMAVQVAARDDLTAILYSAVWEYDPNLRKLVFIVPGNDVRTGAVEFKIIPEDKRVVAAAAEPATDSP